MNPYAIRRIDVWLGTILCFLLTVHRRLADAFRRTPLVHAPRRILFIKLIEQGATVLASDAFARAAALVGRENVFVCVFAGNRAILDVLDAVPQGNIIAVRDQSPVSMWLSLLGAVRTMRALRIDTTVDLEFMARAPAVIAYLSGARTRVGLDRFSAEAPYRGDLLTHRVQHNPHLHTSQAYALLVDALALDPTDVPMPKIPAPRRLPVLPRFAPADDELQRVRALLDARAGSAVTGRVVVLHPSTADLIPLRKWAADRFVELGRRILAAHADVTVVVTGIPSEREGAGEVARLIGSARAVSLAGDTTLRELVVLYSLADVLVASDSGPGHFASLTDVDAVVLFGPEIPALFGPIGEHSHAVWAQLACSPCVSPYNHRFSPCNNNRCMQAITVDEVFARVNSLLEGARA